MTTQRGLLTLYCNLALSCLFHFALALWPIPRSLEYGSTLLKLADNFEIKLNITNVPEDLYDAISRTNWNLHNDKLQRLIVGRGASDSAALANAPSLAQLTVALSPNSPPINSIMDEATKELTNRSESYFLIIPDSDQGEATLIANSSLGLLRGLSTFEQCWYYLSDSGTVYSYQAPVNISDDSPAYPYRGLMLDTARNFFSVDDIKRTLDAMSMVKMSQFHWHVVDAQSFPLMIPKFPELSQKGAYSDQEVYSSDDVQDIVNYAGVRGIDVLMEIDTPGHTAIISTSHPEHIACAEAVPWEDFANEPPAGQLRIASAATTNFTASFLVSIAETLPSKLFSTGGDELNLDCYNQDASTQTQLNNSGISLTQALGVFTNMSHNALRENGKTPVVWEEMALNYNVTLQNDTIIMVWTSSQSAAAVAAKGLRFVHSPSDYFYLDCGAGEWIGDQTIMTSWCDPFKSWQKAYTFDPLANLTETEISLVLGGQQLLWTEQSDTQNLDSIVWPRAAVSAEIFWTGANLPGGGPRSQLEALPRLHDLRFRMVQRGVKAIPLQPQWCALRDGACNAS